MRRHQTSILDIARTTGLSKSTVAYVLNGKYREMSIREETAVKVRQAATAAGYQPNFWAKSLVNRKSCMIGVLLPDLSNTFAQQIVKGVIGELEPRHYEAFLGVSFWDEERERREIKLLLGKKVDGIILLPYVNNRKYYEDAIAEGCPITFISDYLPEVTAAAAVTLDTQDAVRKMVEHLQNSGRQYIVMLGANYPSQTLREREQAFMIAMRENGTCNPRVFKAARADDLSVAEKVAAILTQRPRPDAILCQSDALAHRVQAILALRNLNVPDDIAVTGIGNLEMSAHPLISLTTIDEPLEEMGRAAARLTLEHAEHSISQNSPLRLQGKLMVRKSTGSSAEPVSQIIATDNKTFPTIQP